MEFSIIIPTWNNLELIECCIASIRKNSTFSHEIILHVNDGSDGTLVFAEKEKTEGRLLFTHSKENSGVCFAVNLAAGLATKPFILYLNDDMYCCPDWDSHLISYIQKFGDSPFMLSGTMIERKDTGNPCVVVKNFGDSPKNFDEEGLLKAHANSSLNRTNWIGSTWPPIVIRKSSWELIGGFSTELFPGMSSDNDFSMKLWHSGCRIFLGVGDSLVYHFMSKSNVKIKKNAGRQQFLYKWGITQSTFDRHYLKRGTLCRGEDWLLPEPHKNLSFYKDIFRGYLKKIFSRFPKVQAPKKLTY